MIPSKDFANTLQNLLYPYEVNLKHEEVQQDLDVAKQKLSSQTSRLSYLMRVGREEGLNISISTEGTVTVSKSNNHSDQSAMNDCPVCLEPLTEQKILLPCAHRVCRRCIGMLMCGSPSISLENIQRSSKANCPQCRKRFRRGELHVVSFMTERGQAEDAEQTSQESIVEQEERRSGTVDDSLNLQVTERQDSSQFLPHSVQQYTGTKIASMISQILKLQR